MAKFKVRVYWQVEGMLEVEAKNESEAVEKAWDGNVCQLDSSHSPGRWHVDAVKVIKVEDTDDNRN